MENKVANIEELKAKAAQLGEQLLAFNKNPQWEQSKQIKTDKICTIYTIETGK